jgi:hypothetical protein
MRRRFVRLSVFLLLGAILNIAVAWGCAIWGTLPDDAGQLYVAGDPPRWTFQLDEGFGAQRIKSSPTDEFKNFAFGIMPIRRAVPSWSRVGQPSDDAQSTTVEDGRGWPVIGLRSTMIFEDQDVDAGWTRASNGSFHIPETWNVRNGFRIRDGTRSEDISLLPLRPIWPGFAINTIFFAAILWLLFALPFTIRRRRRIKRGLCVRCGYSLRGNSGCGTCPECGAAIPMPDSRKPTVESPP